MIDLNLSADEEQRAKALAVESVHRGQSLGTLVKRLKHEFSWDVYRAIEVGGFYRDQVLNEDLLEWGRSAGYMSKEWRTGVGRPCPACAKNEGQVVGLNDAFPSGDNMPPAHVGCRCIVFPVR
jgi:hypothetical protein